MNREIRTDLGIIEIGRDVIANLAGIATTECFGVVGVVSSRVFSDTRRQAVYPRECGHQLWQSHHDHRTEYR